MERKKLMKLHELGWTIEDLVELLNELNVEKTENDSTGGVQEKIMEVMLHLGIPMHISGYKYILCAIEICVKDPTILNRITGELYPFIARKYNTEPQRIERGIRYAIESSWKKDNSEPYKKLFGPMACKQHPSNSEFLTTLTVHIKNMKPL